MGSSAKFGWRLPDQTTSPPDVVKVAVDLAEDIEGTLGTVGAWCIAEGTASSMINGTTTISLSSIVDKTPGAAYTLSGGAVLAPWAGVYWLNYHARTTTSTAGLTSVNHRPLGYPVQQYSGATIPATGMLINALAGDDSIPFVAAAGGAFPKFEVSTNAAGASSTCRLLAVYLGNPT